MQNWYKTAKLIDQLEKESALGSKFMSYLYAIVLLLTAGMSLTNISKRLQIPEEEVQKALENTSLVEKAKEDISTDPNISEDVQMMINNIELHREREKTMHMEKELEDLNKKLEISKNPNKKETINNDYKKYLIDIVARTIYGEGEGESLKGKEAIASVIWNRARGSSSKMERVVTLSDKKGKYHAFSCWNNGTPKRGKGKAWEDSCKLASDMVNGTFSPTINSIFYYNPKLANPIWAWFVDKDGKKISRKPFINIENHRFLKEV